MRALVYDDGLKLVDVPCPGPAPGEALIQVLTAGVCNTDLEILKGYMGFRGIPGHEFVGIVAESGNEHLVGKRVVGEINCSCGTCRYCNLEMPHHCLERTVLGIADRDGAFAEYLVLPEENLHLVPSGMRDDVAVFTEPVAAAFRVVEQVGFSADDSVIVLGDGKLGQLVAQVLWLQCKHLVCVGKHAWKLEQLDRVGVPTAQVDEPLEGGADVVVEATGSQEGLSRALDLVRPEGTIVMKTTTAEPPRLDLARAVVNEVRLVGSRCGPFPRALEALALGTVEVRHLRIEEYGIEEGVKALERAGVGDVMKVLIHM